MSLRSRKEISFDEEYAPALKELLEDNEEAEKEEELIHNENEGMEVLMENTAKEQDERLSQSEDGDIRLMVGDLKNIRLPANEDGANVVRFGDLSEGGRWDAITLCLYNKAGSLLENMEYLPDDWYEQDVSCCVIRNQAVEGVLLVRRLPGGELMPVLVHSSGANADINAISLMKYARNAALTKYPEDDKVVVRVHTERIRKAVEYIFREFRK